MCSKTKAGFTSPVGSAGERAWKRYSGGERRFQRQFSDDANVVVDGSVVTSNGSLVRYQAALVLLGKMTSRRHAHSVFEALQMERLIDWERVADRLE